MTEEEWLRCDKPRLLLNFVSERISERQARLFAVAKWRSLPSHFHARKAVDLCEKYADGEINAAALQRHEEEAWEVWRATDQSSEEWGYGNVAVCLLSGSDTLVWKQPPGYVTEDEGEKSGLEAIWIRCIIGNPFRPVALNPTWQTSTVVALAEAAYEDRILPAGTLDTARLAILADALEDTGCDNPDILNHLRQPGEHVRGCWVIDLLCGKGSPKRKALE